MLSPLTTELRCASAVSPALTPTAAILSTLAPACSPHLQDYARLSNYPVLIISYEMFVRSYEVIKKMTFDLIVCDEGHRLKNTTIKTTSVRTSSFQADSAACTVLNYVHLLRVLLA